MLNVGIVGGTGYTGVELMRLLSMHPEARIGAITSRAEEGVSVGDIFPSLRGHVDLTFEKPTLTTLIGCDVVFFATPHGLSTAPRIFWKRLGMVCRKLTEKK